MRVSKKLLVLGGCATMPLTVTSGAVPVARTAPARPVAATVTASLPFTGIIIPPATERALDANVATRAEFRQSSPTRRSKTLSVTPRAAQIRHYVPSRAYRTSSSRILTKPTVVAPPVAAVSSQSPQAFALSLVGSAQFSCLEPMWARESGWNPASVNPSSGAAGIPQFLPSTWADFGYSYFPRDAITQVRAGLRYIDSRYGSPCAAWSFWQAHLWY